MADPSGLTGFMEEGIVLVMSYLGTHMYMQIFNFLYCFGLFNRELAKKRFAISTACHIGTQIYLMHFSPPLNLYSCNS